MSTTAIANFDLFDILVKIIPGGVFLTLAVLTLPGSSPIFSMFEGSGFSLVIAVLPLAYVIGTAIQGVSGECFPRQKSFQSTMRKARDNITFDEKEMTINGGDPVPRFVWADAIIHFKLDEKYLKPSSSEYEPRNYPIPLIYWILCYPLLKFFVIISVINNSSLDGTRKYYGAEREVFRLVEQYVNSKNLGKIERFRSIYVLHRSMTLTCCLLLAISTTVVVSSLITNYQPFVGVILMSVLAVGAFVSVPIFYKGMIRYEGIGDRRMIYAYYNSRINKSPLSDEYAIEK